MPDELDRMLRRLAQGAPRRRLDHLEADVLAGLRESSPAATPAWRFAVVGLALVAGVGIGASTAATSGEWRDHGLSGAGLAPSTLLNGRQ